MAGINVQPVSSRAKSKVVTIFMLLREIQSGGARRAGDCDPNNTIDLFIAYKKVAKEKGPLFGRVKNCITHSH